MIISSHLIFAPSSSPAPPVPLVLLDLAVQLFAPSSFLVNLNYIHPLMLIPIVATVVFHHPPQFRRIFFVSVSDVWNPVLSPFAPYYSLLGLVYQPLPPVAANLVCPWNWTWSWTWKPCIPVFVILFVIEPAYRYLFA